MTAHFIKLLSTFVVMIALGLAGVYLVNTYGQPAPTASVTESCVGEDC